MKKQVYDDSKVVPRIVKWIKEYLKESELDTDFDKGVKFGLETVLDVIDEVRMEIEISLDNGAYMPTKAHDTDAGFDIRTPQAFTLPYADQYGAGMATIDTGVHISIPNGYVGMIKSKSGLNVNHDIVCEGVIDSGYTGSIFVKMYNLGDCIREFQKGEKITQLVIMPIPQVELKQVDKLKRNFMRGNGGFGSTGRF